MAKCLLCGDTAWQYTLIFLEKKNYKQIIICSECMKYVNPEKLFMKKRHEELIDKSWFPILEPALEIAEKDIYPYLAERKKKWIIYPAQENIYRAFKECSLENLKVIILMQNPYHDGSANGLCADNNKDIRKMSPSLSNMSMELWQDTGWLIWGQKIDPNKKSILEHLPEQGVLLLNSALTVEKGVADSHMDIWQPFTEEVVKAICKAKDNIIWVLWGNYALAFKETIEKLNSSHQFIISSHPSPLSCRRPLKQYPAFIGSKPFSKINSILKSLSKKEINW